MTLLSTGIDRYQAHQTFAHTDTSKARETTATQPDASQQAELEDQVSFSDRIAVIEWLADQSPELSTEHPLQPANLRQLTDNLLRYQLIGLPEAGKLLGLAQPDQDIEQLPLPTALQQREAASSSHSEKQQYQHLHRLVETLTAAQLHQEAVN